MALNPTAILGVMTISLGGSYVPSLENQALEPGGLKRTTKSGDQVHGPTATAAPSKATLSFPAQAGVSVKTVNAFRGGATFAGDNGVTWSSSDFWCLGDAKITGGPTGTITATFEGQPFNEVST